MDKNQAENHGQTKQSMEICTRKLGRKRKNQILAWEAVKGINTMRSDYFCHQKISLFLKPDFNFWSKQDRCKTYYKLILQRSHQELSSTKDNDLSLEICSYRFSLTKTTTKWYYSNQFIFNTLWVKLVLALTTRIKNKAPSNGWKSIFIKSSWVWYSINNWPLIP